VTRYTGGFSIQLCLMVEVTHFPSRRLQITESKTVLGQKKVSKEDRMRETMSLDIAMEMLQRAALQTEVLSCIVLGNLPTSPSRVAALSSSSGRAARGSAAAVSPAVGRVHSREGVYSRSASANRMQTTTRRSAPHTPAAPTTPNRLRSSAGAGNSPDSHTTTPPRPGWRLDSIRRTPTGAIDSTPLTGGLKRSTSRSSAGYSSGGKISDGQRTLYPTTPLESLLNDPAAVHSLVGNIDNYCSCCRMKLVEVQSLRSIRVKHSKCHNCIHR
jgi:hypothetical protein